MKRLALTLGLVLALLATSSAALAAAGLSGTYKTTITGEPGPLRAFNGTFTVSFKAGKSVTTGKYTWKHNGAFVSGGNYTISASTITFKDTSGAFSMPYRCPGPGKYSFKVTGKKLKFTVISEDKNCFGRQVWLTKHPFTKV